MSMSGQFGGESELLLRGKMRRARVDVIFRAYFYLGLIIAIFATGYFALSLLNIKLSREQQLALAVGGTGVAVALISRWYLALSRERAMYAAEKFEQQVR